jgi:hypothetical protein
MFFDLNGFLIFLIVDGRGNQILACVLAAQWLVPQRKNAAHGGALAFLTGAKNLALYIPSARIRAQ